MRAAPGPPPDERAASASAPPALPALAASVEEAAPAQAARVVGDMNAPEAAVALAAMDPDDRVDVLGHVPAALHEALLGEMDSADAATCGGWSSTRRTRPAGS